MSFSLKLFSTVSKLTFKVGLGRIKNLKRLRRFCDTMTRLTAHDPKGVVYTDGILNHNNTGVSVEWVNESSAPNPKVLLYIHGGGFIFGSSKTHRHLAADIAVQLGCSAVLPNYRLAPDHQFPCGFDDVIACYNALIQQGVAPTDIVVAGDSAGGNLALLLLAHLIEKNVSLPACVLTFAAQTDFSNQSDSLRRNARSECVLAVHRFNELQNIYAPNVDPTSAEISPLYGDFRGAPPVMLQVSTKEILYDDSVLMHAAMVRQGVDVTLNEYENGFHVFQMTRGIVPEADRAIADAVHFIRPHLYPAKR